jgi:hypothetical protein
MHQGERITAEEGGKSPGRLHGRVAVVLIHGIGDQQPMNTLRDFIAGVYPAGPGENSHVFSKPDRISDVLDLRRMAASAALTGNATDFYELYWAHLLQGSTLAHVGDWFVMLLKRWPSDVPKRLVKFWFTSWIVVILAGILAVYASVTGSWQSTLLSTGVVGLVLYAARGVFRRLVIGYLGDAARYLRPSPENIGVRQTIRNAGLHVLRRLHDEPMQRYERIVVVGHSLGSVIAYDILTYLWQEMHWIHSKPSRPQQPNYEQMRKSLQDHEGLVCEIESFRTMQKEILKEEQTLGMPWKVTDLITMGSPLTYADFLLADRKYSIERRKHDRELPTCPPQLEDERDMGYLSQAYRLDGGSLEQKKLLHHAALFACTRWTNLFFEKDIIGGKVCGESLERLGSGIKDVSLRGETTPGRSVLSHTMYWDRNESEATTALRCAMCLCELKEAHHE